MKEELDCDDVFLEINGMKLTFDPMKLKEGFIYVGTQHDFFNFDKNWIEKYVIIQRLSDGKYFKKAFADASNYNYLFPGNLVECNRFEETILRITFH